MEKITGARGEGLTAPATAPGPAREWKRSGTVVLAASAGVTLSTTHIYSLGVLMTQLEPEFGWSRAQFPRA